MANASLIKKKRERKKGNEGKNKEKINIIKRGREKRSREGKK